MASTPSEPIITLRSPFNGEVIQIESERVAPAMLDAMIQAGFVRLDEPAKTKSTKPQKEHTHGAQ